MLKRYLPLHQLATIVSMVLGLLLMLSTWAHAADFDHLKTGFPLDGPHQHLACESCHVKGQFKGTPRT